MRTFLTILAALLLGGLTSSTAQVRHASTITVRVDGDCPMCEKTIEKAAFVKGEASADWDVDAKTATITIDSTRTTVDAVLRRIAEAGYDNERYLAPDAAYSALPGCCQYERS
ncbi:MAG: heavy-metal-associated domain-containing protein, partial [Bacteroidetes bacterium]|nr:heavy-metal-associated domain-containing protein [Bacteroidota bacterium]